MPEFIYQKATLAEIERIAGRFCVEHGDNKSGGIADTEYDRLFNHIADRLGKYGSFSERSGEKADFKSSRYVDQIPWIAVVPSTVLPSVALSAGLDSVQGAHRPLAISFDFYPHSLLVLPPNQVFTTYEAAELAIHAPTV